VLLLNCKTMTVGPCTNDSRDSRVMRRLRLKLDESGIGGSLAARRGFRCELRLRASRYIKSDYLALTYQSG